MLIKFQSAGCSGCGVTLILGENRLPVTITTGTSFHSFFLILFSFSSTIAMKGAYNISEGWVQQLQSYIDFGWGLTMATGASFHSFFLIPFSFSSTTKCAYKFSEGQVQWLQSYIKFIWICWRITVQVFIHFWKCFHIWILLIFLNL